jgi:hypothetical protein
MVQRGPDSNAVKSTTNKPLKGPNDFSFILLSWWIVILFRLPLLVQDILRIE